MPKDQETAILRFGFMARCRGPFKEETQAAKSESQHRAGVAKQGTEGMASHRGQGGPGEPQRAGHTGLAGDTWVLQSRGSPHIGYERTLRQGPALITTPSAQLPPAWVIMEKTPSSLPTMTMVITGWSVKVPLLGPCACQAPCLAPCTHWKLGN